MDKNLIENYNEKILEITSYILNTNERLITKYDVEQIKKCGVNSVRAVELLFQSFFNLTDKTFVDEYVLKMFRVLDTKNFYKNLYYKNIKFDNIYTQNWCFEHKTYEPYELFVQDDFIYDNGKVIPNLGFFETEFNYPVVSQNGRVWMSVTPNEINTMRRPIKNACGNVLTFGLGLGYFAYMCSLKNDVKSVTIVETDKTVIDLFTKYILPQFENKKKIKIINQDAYKFLKTMDDNTFDYVFVDIYHDAGDGLKVYEKFKHNMKGFNKTVFEFWIYDTIKYYLGEN